MPHNIDLILTFAGGVCVAVVLGYVSHRVGLSPIVGYLLAGLVVGPHTPGFVADHGIAEQFAEVGVILLMFGVGLHFHVEELLAVRKVAIPGAVVQSAAATALGVLVGISFGWSVPASVVFGLSLSVASTVMLTRVLSDAEHLHTPTGHIAVGWLVVEDLFTVVVLVVLPAVFAKDGPASPGAIAWGLALAVLKMAALVAVTFVVGGRVIPWVMKKASETRSRELFTLAVLAVALGVAVGSAKVFGVSMALGAFLAGMVVGRGEFARRAAEDALPMRDAFAVLFFVSVGMLFEPRFLWERPLLVLATTAVVVLAKPLAALALMLVMRYPWRTALAVAVALGQIGEFSFILAKLGTDLNVFNAEGTNALVVAAILSLSLNPLIYRALPAPDGKTGEPSPKAAYRAIIVGHGPVGRTLARLLRENGMAATVVEMNPATVEALRGQGIRAVAGDAALADTLVEAGIADATAVFLTASGMGNSTDIVRLAKSANPKVRVYARVAYVHEAGDVRKAGADDVFAEEGEVALAMTASLMEALGASPDQIDRERDRAREEMRG